MLTACVMSDVYGGDEENLCIERLPGPMRIANRHTTQSSAKQQQPVDIEDLDLAQIGIQQAAVILRASPAYKARDREESHATSQFGGYNAESEVASRRLTAEHIANPEIKLDSVLEFDTFDELAEPKDVQISSQSYELRGKEPTTTDQSGVKFGMTGVTQHGAADGLSLESISHFEEPTAKKGVEGLIMI